MVSRTAGVLLCPCRSGQQQCKAHHKDWLKNQILDVFFASEQAASVVTQGGLLYNVDLTSGVVSSVSSVKVTPSRSIAT